ncbi:MAG TPA: glycosyltransferase WbuB [Clostridiaceae bacterium]|nr:glycosyltransferase WbuB [Clostridiaceae bacterium]
MNVLFMTIAYPNYGANNLFSDLMHEFACNGHEVYIACSNERRHGKPTSLNMEEGKHVLRIRTGNLTGNVNLIEKGFTTLTLERIFIKAIEQHFSGIKFDLILYSTPPITLVRAVEYFKQRDNAITYLLLKDIFPQNAVDLGLIKNGSLLHRYFRKKEKKLYRISDHIGCMSPANVNFVQQHNPEIAKDKVEVCPNSINPIHITKAKKEIRDRYKIPSSSTVFIYGGNLGKPQGIEFIIECLQNNINMKDKFFIVCGTGTEFIKLENFIKKSQPNNCLLINGLPKEEYDELVSACDVGLIFLDYRFTIPNIPSRLLSYMEAALPVLAATDTNTDIGQIIEGGNFGFWCESTDVEAFNSKSSLLCNKNLREQLGANARKYLEDNYRAEHSYNIIINHFKKRFKNYV